MGGAAAVALAVGKIAATLAPVVGTAIGLKKASEQGRQSARDQRTLINQQATKQRVLAQQQEERSDEINKKKAANQRSVLGGLFQRTLSGSRTGVTRNFGGG